MAKIYVQLIIKGKRKFSKVPAPIKEEVRQLLIDMDLEYLIDD
ncbi:MAG: CD1375 family protein [[Clostridium] aminophilum]|nr:CD1375 family protein [[Clostridium] aminophilum]MDD6195422.1 CD1375 family protein [[Clostridium] aminophilum]